MTSSSAIIWVEALVSGVFAGIVATLATVAIERFGGALGGVLATSPTTIVAASVGLALAVPDDGPEFVRGCFVVPLGMLTNVVFLLLWRVVPAKANILQRDRGHSASSVACSARSIPFLEWLSHDDSRQRKLLAFTLVCSLIYWIAAASSLVALLSALSATITVVAGLCALTLMVLGGLFMVLLRPVPAPRGTNKVGRGTLFARGLFASVSIFCGVLAAPFNAVLAGMLNVFPAIFITTMVSIWLAQGPDVSTGAVGPMMLGASAVPAYIILFFTFQRFLFDGLSLGARIATSLLSAYMLTILGVVIPCAAVVRWRASTSPTTPSFVLLNEDDLLGVSASEDEDSQSD